MKTIDIVLPVYNEEEGIAAFHRVLTAVLDPLCHRYEFHFIYVLDRSQDDTLRILKELSLADGRITVLHLSRRFGHQMSLVAGMDHSRGDALIMMDCDQQHPPVVIPLLLDTFDKGYDIVHTIREYDVGTGLLKRLTSNAFYKIQNALSPVELRTGGADFRLISRRVVRVFQTSVREQNQFLRGLFQWIGFSNTTVPFVSAPRPAGTTKYDVRRLLTFAVIGILSFSKVPLRLASLFGFVISTLSLLYGTALVIFYMIGGQMPWGYTSLIVVILFMGGLQLTVLGILGEYIGSIFDETKNRPLYIVDEVIQGSSL